MHVLLQFSVPVFAGNPGAPALAWSARRDGDDLLVSAHNQGRVPVKLAGPALGGIPLAQGPVYLLPGARRDFKAARPASLHVTAHDALSGRDLDADVAP